MVLGGVMHSVHYYFHRTMQSVTWNIPNIISKHLDFERAVFIKPQAL